MSLTPAETQDQVFSRAEIRHPHFKVNYYNYSYNGTNVVIDSNNVLELENVIACEVVEEMPKVGGSGIGYRSISLTVDNTEGKFRKLLEGLVFNCDNELVSSGVVADSLNNIYVEVEAYWTFTDSEGVRRRTIGKTIFEGPLQGIGDVDSQNGGNSTVTFTSNTKNYALPDNISGVFIPSGSTYPTAVLAAFGVSGASTFFKDSILPVGQTVIDKTYPGGHDRAEIMKDVSMLTGGYYIMRTGFTTDFFALESMKQDDQLTLNTYDDVISLSDVNDQDIYNRIVVSRFDDSYTGAELNFKATVSSLNSIDVYGVKELRLVNPLVGNPSVAQQIAQRVLDHYKSGSLERHVTIMANNILELGNSVSLIERYQPYIENGECETTKIANNYTIRRIVHSFDSSGYRQDLTLVRSYLLLN